MLLRTSRRSTVSRAAGRALLLLRKFFRGDPRGSGGGGGGGGPRAALGGNAAFRRRRRVQAAGGEHGGDGGRLRAARRVDLPPVGAPAVEEHVLPAGSAQLGRGDGLAVVADAVHVLAHDKVVDGGVSDGRIRVVVNEENEANLQTAGVPIDHLQTRLVFGEAAQRGLALPRTELRHEDDAKTPGTEVLRQAADVLPRGAGHNKQIDEVGRLQVAQWLLVKGEELLKFAVDHPKRGFTGEGEKTGQFVD